MTNDLVSQLQPQRQSLRPKIRPLEHKPGPWRADEHAAAKLRGQLGRIHGAIDLVARAGDIAEVKEGVTHREFHPVRDLEAKLDASLRSDGEAVAGKTADV